jgi:hypothetical protein
MKKKSYTVGIEEALSPPIEKVTDGFSRLFSRRPGFLWCLLAAVILLILSPLIFFWLDLVDRKDWSETVKNVVEALAVVAGAFALVQWVTERRDRATDILFQMMDKFDKVNTGKQMIDDNSEYAKIAPALSRGAEQKESCVEMDKLLDFYILLHGVRHARQVPDAALSVCFRYWLAHYFHKDRKEFRGYVETFYPTLTRWLREDCKNELPFFRPRRLFKEKTDEEFIKQCCKEAIP